MTKQSLRSVDLWIAVCLVILTLAVYRQVAGFEFTNIDDDFYVENNAAVQAGLNPQAIRWAFTTNYQANWHPLTWISLMADTDFAKVVSWTLDLSLGRKNSGFYHLTNLILHVANVVLLFVVLNALTSPSPPLEKRGIKGGWPGAFVAALFAVHPLHVESVAWIAERKDVLSTLFWLLTMLAYVRYARQPSGRSYLWVLAAYALGLMAKPMLVSLPIVLLLLDLWPLGRLQVAGCRLQRPGAGGRASGAGDNSKSQIPNSELLRHLILEKAPLFALAAVSCALTVWAQRAGGAVAGLEGYPFGVRLANAAVAYAAYLWKMIWPSNLAVLYLHPGTTLPLWQVALSGLGLVGVTLLAIRAARTRPYVTVGWLWYVITLVPVIGLVQVGKQAMADRYTYVPLIGIFIIIAWGALDLLGVREERPSRGRSIGLGIAACVVVAVLAVAAYPVVGVWRDSITLFTQALKVDPTNSLAYNNIGNALMEQGDPDGAVEYLRKALKYHPEYTDAQYNLANAYREQGKIDEAVAQYRRVIRGCPRHPKARNNLGSIYALQGKYDLAIAQYEAVLKIDPNSQSARDNLEKTRQAKEGELR